MNENVDLRGGPAAGVGPTALPRLLVIDLTRIGDGTATGELKANYLAGWPAERLMQVFRDGDAVAVSGADNAPRRASAAAALAMIDAFDPDLILYRPVPENGPVLHALAMRAIFGRSVPVAIWVMDDWPERVRGEGGADPAVTEDDLRSLLGRASLRLSIGEAMSAAFAARYGVPFRAFANGVDPAQWTPAHRGHGPVTVRYCGSLAENMTLDSVARVGEAVERLSGQGIDIRLEINTRPLWAERATARFAGLKRTSFSTRPLPGHEYRAWLQGADILLIAYNFDEASVAYTRYSMANKLPECLASGAAVLVVGPVGSATIDHARALDGPVVVTTPDLAVLTAELKALALSPERRRTLAETSRRTVFTRHNMPVLRQEFQSALAMTALQPSVPSADLPRSVSANVDESAVVAAIVADRRGAQHVMLDVGAHVGSSAAPFAALGWRIICFEPDQANRARLTTRFAGSPLVEIDPRAVGEAVADGVPLYTSSQSSGISGLHAFHQTHQQTQSVAVTTLRDEIARRNVTRVDFLKIDVEGYERAVLNGFPWDSGILPAVVECEFEDAKTRPLGYEMPDLAKFLGGHGYTVYVSEWHPIVRYGTRHDWRRVFRFGSETVAPDGWGNLLAFREDPGEDLVRRTFESAMTFRPLPESVAAGSGARVAAPAMSHSGLRGRLRSWVLARGGGVIEAARFAAWGLRSARRHPLRFVAGLIAGLALFVVGFWVPVAWLVLGLAMMAATAAALVGYFAVSLEVVRAALLAEIRALRKGQSALPTLAERARKIEARQYELTAELRADLARQAAAEAAARNTARDAARKEMAALADEQSARVQAVGDRLKQVATALVDLDRPRRGGERPPSAWQFRRFNRVPTEEQVASLVEWGGKLGVPVHPAALGYMAQRLRTVENQMRGRLATSVEDCLLRILVASAAPGPRVSILEIGTLFGVGAAVLYDALVDRFETVELTLLDPLDGYYASRTPDIVTALPVTEAGLWRNLALAQVPSDAVRLIKRLSTDDEALREASVETYDVLVIDADHTLAGVKADCDRYAGLVKAGGFIVFDDYGSPSWPDVKTFVDDEVARNPRLEWIGSAFFTAVCRVRAAS